LLPLPDVNKVAFDGRRRRHGGGDQVGAAAAALAAFEVAVRGARAALPRGELVGVHRQAHAAACLAPVETSLAEDLIEPLGFCLPLYQSTARDHHRTDVAAHLATLGDGGRRTEVF